MINKISVENFKSLKKINIPLKSLNIFAGLNGTGKSSLIQVFLLLKQSNLTGKQQLELKRYLFDAGNGSDLLYQFASDEIICFNLEWGKNKYAEYKFEWSPESHAFNKVRGSITEEYIDNMQYLSADRLRPSVTYDMSNNLKDKLLGSDGQYTAHFLAVNGNRLKIVPKRFHPSTSSPFLINQVNAWLGELSPGVKINVTKIPGADKILVNYEFELLNSRTQAFKPTNVGFGISYALSIIIALLIAEQDQLVIIENPEAHIHPRGQVKLAKLMALAAASGAQLIVETHSDHIINGVRVAVKEGHLSHHDVQCPWFYKVTTEDEQYTEIINIQVDKNGELSEYPEDFMEEYNNQLLRLV